MNWIDSHCHLEGFLNRGTLPEILEHSRDAGVSRLITIGTDPEDWKVNHDLSTKFSEKIHYTVGLHPNHVDSLWENYLADLSPYFTQEPKPVAVGEIGLHHPHPTILSARVIHLPVVAKLRDPFEGIIAADAVFGDLLYHVLGVHVDDHQRTDGGALELRDLEKHGERGT